MITHDTKNHMFEINYPEGRAYLEYTEDNGTVTVIQSIPLCLKHWAEGALRPSWQKLSTAGLRKITILSNRTAPT